MGASNVVHPVPQGESGIRRIPGPLATLLEYEVGSHPILMVRLPCVGLGHAALIEKPPLPLWRPVCLEDLETKSLRSYVRENSQYFRSNNRMEVGKVSANFRHRKSPVESTAVTHRSVVDVSLTRRRLYLRTLVFI
jgi:hypothetical protein